VSDRSQGSLFRDRARLVNARSEFLQITCDRYHAMQQRVGEKRDSRNRLIRVGQQLPFTLEQFRVWIRKQLGRDEQGLARCLYCNRPLNLRTLQIDHHIPLAQAGTLNLGNLRVICKPCNDQKGALRPQAFIALLHLVNNHSLFTEIDRADCLERLQMALKLALRSRYKPAGATGEQAPRVRVLPHVRLPQRPV
jgi:5-methylcytosine-specific restriction endonuclease McrA